MCLLLNSVCCPIKSLSTLKGWVYVRKAYQQLLCCVQKEATPHTFTGSVLQTAMSEQYQRKMGNLGTNSALSYSTPDPQQFHLTDLSQGEANLLKLAGLLPV